MNEINNTKARVRFVAYCLAFYGAKGLYDINATKEQVESAVDTYCRYSIIQFEGDSFDREGVREILESKYGLGTPDEQLPDDSKWMLEHNRSDLAPIKKALNIKRLGLENECMDAIDKRLNIHPRLLRAA